MEFCYLPNAFFQAVWVSLKNKINIFDQTNLIKSKKNFLLDLYLRYLVISYVESSIALYTFDISKIVGGASAILYENMDKNLIGIFILLLQNLF